MIKMKFTFFCGLLSLLLSNNVFSQISNANEFLNFALLSPKQKHLYISGKNWRGVGVDTKSENNKIIEDAVYSKEINNVSYEMTLRGIVEGNGNTIYVTMLLISDESIYNSWVKAWKNSGVDFKKDPNGSNKYMSFGDDFMIMLELVTIDETTFYKISII